MLAKQVFGEYVNVSSQNEHIRQSGITVKMQTLVTIEQLGEQHNTEDFKYNPDASEWYNLITLEDWMKRSVASEVIEKLLIRKFGGEVGDYQFLIDFFNQFNTDDPRSKFILNHSWGIFDAESVFGIVFNRKSDNKEMPTRTVAESVINTNFGKIPTPCEWTDSITEQKWQYANAMPLSQDARL